VTREGRSKLINDVVKSDLSKEEKTRRIERINTKTWSIDFDDIRAAMITKSANRVKKLSRSPISGQSMPQRKTVNHRKSLLK
jgi:hypothetical protein